jgi:hypothetical protein
MSISINIPKDQEQLLRDAWGSGLDRAVFEGLLVESYRAARLSAGELAELLEQQVTEPPAAQPVEPLAPAVDEDEAAQPAFVLEGPYVRSRGRSRRTPAPA